MLYLGYISIFWVEVLTMSNLDWAITFALIISLTIVLGFSHATNHNEPMGTTVMGGAYG